jgi:hypothetical protein
MKKSQRSIRTLVNIIPHRNQPAIEIVEVALEKKSHSLSQLAFERGYSIFAYPKLMLKELGLEESGQIENISISNMDPLMACYEI